MAIIIFLCGGKNKRAPFQCSLLSYLDSNQDKLIQSQMCYRYTIGQSLFFAFFFSLKAGAKVLTFSELTKYFFAIAFLSLSYLLYISVLFALFFYWAVIPDADIRCRLSLLSDRNSPLAAVPFSPLDKKFFLPFRNNVYFCTEKK